MSAHTTRPEDRCRGARTRADFADTAPACFRSEGFAEDLHEHVAAGLAQARASGGRREWVVRTAQALRGTVPSLGLVAAGLLGPFGR